MAAKNKKKNPIATIESHTHKKSKRKNIPTAELQDFIKEDETKPKKKLYPRDPSLDPHQNPLELPSVPIYI